MWTGAEGTAERSGQAIIRLTMDEASLPLSFDDQKGAVIRKVHSQKVKLVSTRNKQRGSRTLVAGICDNTAIQP